jgi:hypothetical protein
MTLDSTYKDFHDTRVSMTLDSTYRETALPSMLRCQLTQYTVTQRVRVTNQSVPRLSTVHWESHPEQQPASHSLTLSRPPFLPHILLPHTHLKFSTPFSATIHNKHTHFWREEKKKQSHLTPSSK